MVPRAVLALIERYEVSRLRGWAVNTPEWKRLSAKAQPAVRQRIGGSPEEWTAADLVLIRSGVKMFGEG